MSRIFVSLQNKRSNLGMSPLLHSLPSLFMVNQDQICVFPHQICVFPLVGFCIIWLGNLYTEINSGAHNPGIIYYLQLY